MANKSNSNKKNQSNPFEFFKDMKIPTIDYEALMAVQRQNLETLSTTQKSAMEAIKTIAGLQQEYTKNAIEQANLTLKQIMGAKSLEEQMKVQTDAMKAGLEEWTKHNQKMSKHWNETSRNLKEEMGTSLKKGMKDAQAFYENAKKAH